MSDDRPYQCTQSAGSGSLAVVLLALLAVVVAAVASPKDPLVFALGLVLAVALLLLHSVGIVVDDRSLRIRLGIGWIRWEVPREDIVAVDTVRLARRGILPLARHEGAWMVGYEGEDAVRLSLVTGALYVLTREPVELALALRNPRETA